MRFGDIDSSRNPRCTCSHAGDKYIFPVEKAVQYMRDANVEVVETFDWRPHLQ